MVKTFAFHTPSGTLERDGFSRIRRVTFFSSMFADFIRTTDGPSVEPTSQASTGKAYRPRQDRLHKVAGKSRAMRDTTDL